MLQVVNQIIALKIQKMTTQAELEQKLASVTKKLKQICQSYNSLKEKMRGKDQQILKLRMEITRLIEADEMKENARVKEIRKKYQMESTFRPVEKAVPRITLESGEGRESRGLKNVRSMSPHQFAKPMQALQPFKKPAKNLQKQPKRAPAVPFTLQNSMPSAIELSKSHVKNQELTEIDHRFSKDFDSREHRQTESEASMLKQLWQQRDKEIKRMDDLFENLNKKIYGV